MLSCDVRILPFFAGVTGLRGFDLLQEKGDFSFRVPFGFCGESFGFSSSDFFSFFPKLCNKLLGFHSAFPKLPDEPIAEFLELRGFCDYPENGEFQVGFVRLTSKLLPYS